MSAPQTSLLFDLPNPNSSNSLQHQQMLKLMLEMGMNKEVIASLLELADYSIHHLRWFAGPVIVYQSSWLETIPNWLPQAVYLDRLEQIFTEHNAGEAGNLATPAEVLACLYPASLEHPLHRDWVNVYLWCGNAVMTKHNRLSETTLWEQLGDKYPIDFKTIQNDFNSLARDIRHRVVETAKQRGWGKRNKAKTSSLTQAEPSIVPTQLSLF